MNYSVIILAAGSGSRMKLGYNKMLLTIEGQPLITLSSRLFFLDSHCKEIIYVVGANEEQQMKTTLTQYNLYDKRCKFVIGGNERQESVYNGLSNVLEDLVLVHDGARPYISKQLINELVQTASKIGCAIPGVKVKDTIKEVDADQFISNTPDRNLLWAAQTPQAVRTNLLKKAHKKAKMQQVLGTDEASLIEHFKLSSVKVVESSYHNIKITTPDDLKIAADLLPIYINN